MKLNDIDIFCLTETWLYEGNPLLLTAEKIYNYNHVFIPAIRSAEVGRYKGGISIYYKKSGFKWEKIFSDDNTLTGIITVVNTSFIIMVSYVSPADNFDIFAENLCDKLGWLQESYDLPIFIGGDFNARIAELNQIDQNLYLTSKISCVRNSKDKTVNSRGKKLLNIMDHHNFILLNGRSLSDSNGNFTYFDTQGKSVNDLIWTNLNSLNYVEDLDTACCTFI